MIILLRRYLSDHSRVVSAISAAVSSSPSDEEAFSLLLPDEYRDPSLPMAATGRRRKITLTPQMIGMDEIPEGTDMNVNLCKKKRRTLNSAIPWELKELNQL